MSEHMSGPQNCRRFLTVARLGQPALGEHLLYGFLTTDANGIVGPVRPRAMPVILTTAEEFGVWLRAPWARLQHFSGPCLTR